MKVSRNDYSQLNGKIKIMFQTTNQYFSLFILGSLIGDIQYYGQTLRFARSLSLWTMLMMMTMMMMMVMMIIMVSPKP